MPKGSRSSFAAGWLFLVGVLVACGSSPVAKPQAPEPAPLATPPGASVESPVAEPPVVDPPLVEATHPAVVRESPGFAEALSGYGTERQRLRNGAPSIPTGV